MLRVDRLYLLFLVVCVLAFPMGSFAGAISYDQCATCGPTGGAALQVFFTNVTAPDVTAIGLVNTSASFNPSGITNITATVSKDVTVSQATPFTGTFASGFRPLIEQDGIIYIANPAIVGPVFGSNTTPATSFSSGWGTIECDPTNSAGCPASQTSLTLSNFLQFSFTTGTFGTAHPNASGSNLFFGLAVINTTNNTQIVNSTNETDFANLNISDGPLLVDSNFSDLSDYQAFEFTGVPEPSTIVLLGLGLVGLGWRGRSEFRLTILKK